ncbi:hypothetical protein ACFW04_013691 [Cataglyphis niger]
MTSINNTLKNLAILNSENKTTIVEANRKENPDKYKLVLLLRSTYDKNLFHNNFDTWTIEQNHWINKNLSKSLFKLPEWLDMDKYHRGQKFVRENYASIMIIKLLGIIHVYTFNDNLKPIIIEEHGTQAYKDLQVANKLHLMMRRKLYQMDNEQIDAISKIVEPWCPDHEILLKDFAMACPFETFDQRSYIMISETLYRPKGINNMDLIAIQAVFVCMVLLRPQDIGIHNAIDKDIDALCHMWRCYGYFLGLEDNEEENYYIYIYIYIYTYIYIYKLYILRAETPLRTSPEVTAAGPTLEALTLQSALREERLQERAEFEAQIQQRNEMLRGMEERMRQLDADIQLSRLNNTSSSRAGGYQEAGPRESIGEQESRESINKELGYKLKPDIFDGSVSLREFFSQFELIVRANKWSNATKTVALISCLRGKA